MTTNKPTQNNLERIAELIEEIYAREGKDCVAEINELNTRNRRLKRHITAQKSQGGQYPNDEIIYDADKNVTIRMRNGEIVNQV
jgi:hypothetical protein